MIKTTSEETPTSIPTDQQDPGILWSQPKLTVLSGEQARGGTHPTIVESISFFSTPARNS